MTSHRNRSSKRSRSRSRPRKRRFSQGKSKNWIRGAIKNPGSLRKYAKKNYPGTGKNGAFTEKGTLKMSWINKMLKRKEKCQPVSTQCRLHFLDNISTKLFMS